MMLASFLLSPSALVEDRHSGIVSPPWVVAVATVLWRCCRLPLYLAFVHCTMAVMSTTNEVKITRCTFCFLYNFAEVSFCIGVSTIAAAVHSFADAGAVAGPTAAFSFRFYDKLNPSDVVLQLFGTWWSAWFSRFTWRSPAGSVRRTNRCKRRINEDPAAQGNCQPSATRR